MRGYDDYINESLDAEEGREARLVGDGWFRADKFKPDTQVKVTVRYGVTEQDAVYSVQTFFETGHIDTFFEAHQVTHWQYLIPPRLDL